MWAVVAILIGVVLLSGKKTPDNSAPVTAGGMPDNNINATPVATKSVLSGLPGPGTKYAPPPPTWYDRFKTYQKPAPTSSNTGIVFATKDPDAFTEPVKTIDPISAVSARAWYRDEVTNEIKRVI
jgi:hypothetical protein